MPLDPDRWNEVERLFAASADLDEAARRDLLDRECADAGVRREVERLLAHDAGSSRHVTGAIREAMTSASGPRRERIGPYRVQREIGRGGMGTVYLAVRDDEEYSKQVAIKLVPGGVEGDTLLQRFRVERQILATLEHANIARLLDGGATEDGLPYLVMEYVDGEPIDAYCDRRSLGIEARLRIFRSVCAAVQYAHANLVVHRDIKPANILVTAGGEPKLLDFGIAKLLEGDAAPAAPTRTAARLMTPEYASPEQVRGDPITTATDVYSLGVLLYELLTGRRPYRLASRRIGEVARAIAEQEPERPSTAVTREPADTDPGGADTTSESISRARDMLPADLRRRLADDLDDIVLMALRKEPRRRYASVASLSEDIRRHLEGLPVVARKDTWGYRSAKFVRRNPWGLAAAAAILLLIAGFGAASFVQARRIAGERDRALAAEAAARTEAATALRVTDFLVELFEHSDPEEARGREIPVREILDRGARRVRGELEGEAEVQARLMTTIARVYGNLGLYSAALPLAEAALEQRRRLHGEDAPDVARVRTQIGGLQMHLGNREAAEREIVAGLERQRAALGPAHDDIVTSLNILGMLREQQGRYDESVALHREALAMARALHGDRHALVGNSANNLGWALDQKGAYEESEKVQRENLAMRRELHGKDHPSVGSSLNNLGQLLADMGRHVEAEALLRENVDLCARVYGEESFSYANALGNLSYVLKTKGESAAAEPLETRALELTRSLLGPEHPQTLRRMNNLANLQHDQGKYAEAERIHRRLLEANRRIMGDRHPETAGTLNNLASLLWDIGRFDEAEPLFREAIAADIATLGPDHGYVAMDYSNLAVVLRDRGRAADRREAEELFAKSVQVARKAYGDDHRSVAVNEVQYGLFLVRTGRLDEGERRVREGLRIFEAVHPSGHFQIDMARAMLGECLAARGRYEEAETLVVGGYDALRRSLGDRAGVTRRARAQVVRLYEAWGQPDKAAAYRKNGGPG
jgi:serine/threonine-protein kinase